MTLPSAKTRGRTLVRWISWLFGLVAVVTVALFAAHFSEEEAFARLLLHARPAWLVLGVVLQMGTYLADARIWQRVLLRARIAVNALASLTLGASARRPLPG